jgi:hypothetical protein
MPTCSLWQRDHSRVELGSRQKICYFKWLNNYKLKVAALGRVLQFFNIAEPDVTARGGRGGKQSQPKSTATRSHCAGVIMRNCPQSSGRG